MKFVGDGRAQMRERQRRDRASMPLMRERYPRLASLQLDFGFTDQGGFAPAPQMIVLHPPARAYLIFPCPYADCDGEFNLSPAVDELANGGQMRDQGRLRCSGHRKVVRGTDHACGLVLDYRVMANRD